MIIYPRIRTSALISASALVMSACVLQPSLPANISASVGPTLGSIPAAPLPPLTPTPISLPSPSVTPSSTPNLSIVDVVVGYGGVRASSIDQGHSWQVDNDGNSGSDCWAYRAMAYGNGKWVAVGFTGGYGRVSTTPDGVHWRHYENMPATAIEGVTYGGGKFVSDAFTSTDGYTFNFRALNASVGGHPLFTYLNGNYIVSGDQYGIAIGTDGTNFVTKFANYTSPNAQPYFSGLKQFAIGNGIVVGIGASRIASSADNGNTWTNQDNYFGYGQNAGTGITTYNNFGSIAYEGNKFVIYGGSGNYGATSTLWTSTDGITWTQSIPNGTSPVFMGGVYGSHYVGRSRDYLWNSPSTWFTSPDGSTWTAATTVNISPAISDTSSYYLNAIVSGVPSSDPRTTPTLPASVLLTHAQVLSACGTPLPPGR